MEEMLNSRDLKIFPAWGIGETFLGGEKNV
jgi:hypothetical protein